MAEEGRAVPAGSDPVEHLLSLGGVAYRLAARVLGSREGAEDAVQQAYLEAFGRLRQGPPPADPRAWFLRLVANRAKDHLKMEARRRRREAAAMRTEGVSIRDERELVDSLRRAMDELESDYRLPVALCCEEGMSQREAAAVLELPESTLRDRLGEGLERLRKTLARSGYAAAPAAVMAGLAHTAPAVPATLSAALAKLAAGGTVVKGTGAAAATVAAKGGAVMKIAVGVIAAGVLAGAGALLLPGGKPAPLAAPPAAQPAWPTKIEEEPLIWVNKVDQVNIDGPEFQAAIYSHTMAGGDGEGNGLYMDTLYQNLRLHVSSEKRVYTMGGTPGYRDGPIEFAQFRNFYEDTVFVAPVGRPKGGFYVYDVGNKCVRSIAKDDKGRWMVSTFLPPGKVGSVQGLTMSPEGTLYVSSWDGIFEVKDDGRISKFAPQFPAGTDIGGLAMTFDKKGRKYYRTGRGIYWRQEDDGKVTWLCGTKTADGKNREMSPVGKDGPAAEATFHCPATLGPVFPDGSALIVGGGDEFTIRKLSPISPDGRVSTLMPDGTWKECKDKYQGWQVSGGLGGDGMIYRAIWAWVPDGHPVRTRRLKGIRLWAEEEKK